MNRDILNKTLDNLFNQPVNIIEEPWHYLSPFSAHEINIWGEVFKTHEHAYQASRLQPGAERDSVKNAKSPLQAWLLAQEYKANKDVFIDHSREKLEEITEELFRAKAQQHEDVQEILKRLKGRGILKVFGSDANWGTGRDASGKNFMGKLWMKIAEEL